MDKIDELLTRGVANIIPNKETLEKILRSDKKLNIYLGIDPTSPHIHLGHAVALRKLKMFADLGHHVTFLIGDFTTLVGDTSDKDSERPILTSDEIDKNFQTYKKQAERILDFSKVKIAHNSEWLEILTYKDILKLKQLFSVNDFISRELIRKRLDEGKRVRLDETEYPIMQGYDSYFLDTDVQIGGTDQTFNMQAGRTLQKILRKKESFALATEFLMGTDGRKMSKSWGNAIWFDDNTTDMYAKVMAITDNAIVEYFTLATNMPMPQVAEIKKELNNGRHPMDLKKQLAFRIVSELHSKDDAQKAQDHFERTVQKKELPDEIQEIELDAGDGEFVNEDLLVTLNLASSKSEAKRLFQQGGVEVNGKRIENPNANIPIANGTILKIGKRRIVKLKIE